MLFVSQRKLRAPGQVAALMACVRSGEPLPPILLSEDDDGTVQIEDGHHRATAFWLCGRGRLGAHEYLLFPRTRRRPRFGRLADLVARVRAGGGLVGLRGQPIGGRDPPARSRGGRVRRMTVRAGSRGQVGGRRPHLTERGPRPIVGR